PPPPQRDNRRRGYNLKEQKLGKAYREAMELPANSSDAIKIEKWKTPTTKDPAAGEFSTVAYEVIKSRSSVLEGSLTIDEVNTILDQLSQAGSNIGADGQKRPIGKEHARILKKCMDTMTPAEHKWLIRIILRDLKIGMGERSIFLAQHPDAMQLFNTCSDIKRVCWKLYDPKYRLPNEDNDVTPLSVFRPMLCQRNQRDLEDVVKHMRKERQPNADADAAALRSKDDEDFYTKEEFMIEEKLDGERMQLHKVGERYMYCSRKSTDYTYLYGKDKSSGSLTPFIHDLLEGVEEIVLDGEMLAWDPVVGKHIAFGTLKTFAQKTSFDSTDSRPCFIVFDIVHLKMRGHVQKLISQPTYARKKLLKRVVAPRKGVLELAEVHKASTAQDISAFLKHILETRGEGLCVKNPDARYELGGRIASWIKVKPDYMDELGENIDALVIGGYWGTGNRAGRMSSFMVGLRDPTREDVDGEPCYLSFAKVGSGFKADLLLKIHSFVVKIKAAEIVGGVDYGAEMTLRFPRAMGVREDMDCRDCMTVESEFLRVSMTSIPSLITPRERIDVLEKKKSGNTRSFGDDLRGKRKGNGGGPQSKKPRTMAARIGKVEQVTDIFKGYTFYVHRGAKKAEIERAIAQQGGKIIQTIPDPSVPRFVVAEKYEGIKSKKGAAAADILLPAWIEDSIKAQRRLPRVKRYYIHITPGTEASQEYNSTFHEEMVDAPKVEDEKDNDDFETEEPDFKPAPTSTIEPRFAFRDEERDEDEEDEEAGSDEGDRNGTPEPETEDESDVAMDAKPDGDDDRGVLPGFQQVSISSQEISGAPPGMGAGLGEEHFSNSEPAKMFSPLVAYFDFAENAISNNLPESNLSAKTQEAYSQALRDACKDFVRFGGEATANLLDPKLTFIVVHPRVKDRYSELTRKTSQPRNRRIVSYEWIIESIGEETVLDAVDFAP
ncbi:DNA ligase 4, partial [Phenoliferia sp. Uapishka_3]